ncbi:MAG: hypothetical protein ACE5JK_02385 [Candidatus Omnitrophota bacterium]
MRKKKYIQACEMGVSIYGKKKGKKVNTRYKNVRKKDLANVYNKFFKDQVSALYRAINNS